MMSTRDGSRWGSKSLHEIDKPKMDSTQLTMRTYYRNWK